MAWDFLRPFTSEGADMGRMLEATQFLVQDFELFKAGTKQENPVKQRALELLAEAEKNKDHELNTRCGGIQNVRRIRVLRDSEDTTPELKSLELKFELKAQEREIQKQKMEEEDKKRREQRRQEQTKNSVFPAVIADMRAEVVMLLGLAAEDAQKFPEMAEVPPALKALSEQIANSVMDRPNIAPIRIQISKLFIFTERDENTPLHLEIYKRFLFEILDVSQSLLCLITYTHVYDENVLGLMLKVLGLERQKQHFQKNKPRPQNRPNGPQAVQKPQRPPQAPTQA